MFDHSNVLLEDNFDTNVKNNGKYYYRKTNLPPYINQFITLAKSINPVSLHKIIFAIHFEYKHIILIVF